jgi:hypothetical protein
MIFYACEDGQNDKFAVFNMRYNMLLAGGALNLGTDFLDILAEAFHRVAAS